jgi:hypothetical protein
MPDWHVLLEGAPELTVVFGHHAQHACAGGQVFDNHDADIVATIMDKQMRYIAHAIRSHRTVIFLPK